MGVWEVKSGAEVGAVIERLAPKEFGMVRASHRFGFDWGQYRGLEVYKLKILADDLVVGLICLIDHPSGTEDAIEIECLESSKENVGNAKQYDGIAGSLITFACRESFKRGHEGFVFLRPKTGLIKHYIEVYGFQHFPLKTAHRPEGIMVLDGRGARNLIKRFLE